MLEVYSKGKVIRVKTNKLVKKKKVKGTKVHKYAGGILSSDDEAEAGANPLEEMANNPDAAIDEINKAGKETLAEGEEGNQEEEDLELSGEDEEFTQEYRDRVFHFISEISILVDYQVISRYLQMLKSRSYLKH